jgi:hypothetical protein
LSDLNIRIEIVAPLSSEAHYPIPRQTRRYWRPVLTENLAHPSESEAISKDNSLFFKYLRHATRAFPLGPLTDCTINDFTAFLLSMLDYDDETKRFVHLGMELDLMMCGKLATVNPDVVIMHNQDYILLVQVRSYSFANLVEG